MFSMFIDINGHSKIQIGGYDLDKYGSWEEQEIHWYSLSSRHSWDVTLEKVSIGDWVLPTVAINIMADTGTSLNMLPDEDYF